jgi:hypothetical protein
MAGSVTKGRLPKAYRTCPAARESSPAWVLSRTTPRLREDVTETLTPSLHRLTVGRTAKLERFGSARHKVQMIQRL